MDAVSEEDFEAWAAYRKAKRAQKDATSSRDPGTHEKRNSSEVGRTKNGFYRRTEERNRCYTCNSEYRFAP